MPKPMCSAIHHGLCITAFGSVNPCCATPEFTKISEIKNITEHWFSKNTDLQKARDNEWTDNPLPACVSSCYQKDKKQIVSRKAKMAEWYPFINEEYTKKHIYDIVHMDISFGNTCNQKCIMCNSKFSSQWLDDDKILIKEAPYIRTKFNTLEKNWSLSYEQIDQIIDLISDQTLKIEFKGGEPLYDKRFFYFVEKALKKNENIDFNICTNGSFFNEKSINFLNSIPKIKIDISIDGINETYNWIRGFDFKIIEKNFRYFLANCKIEPAINYTTMRYNVDKSDEIYNWIADLSQEYNRRINLQFTQVVQNPKYMSPEYAEKNKIISAIEKLKYIDTDPRKIRPYSHFHRRNKQMLIYLENHCLPKQITDIDRELVEKTDNYMKTIRGYDFDSNM